MGLFENCPNCGSKTWNGNFCSGCERKRDAIFWETGVSYNNFSIQLGDLDREISRINIGKIWKKAEEEKKRKLSFLIK